MVFVEFLEFICRIAHVCSFSEPEKKKKAAETTDEENLRPELSEGHDQIEEVKKEKDSDSSD